MCDCKCVRVMRVCVFPKVTSALRMVPVLRFSLCLLPWRGVFVHLSPTALCGPEKQFHSHGCQYKWQHHGAPPDSLICVPCVPNSPEQSLPLRNLLTLWGSEWPPLGRRKRRVRAWLPCLSHSVIGQAVLWENLKLSDHGKSDQTELPEDRAGDLWGQGTWGLGAAEEDSQTTQCYHRNLVPSKSLGAVDTALKNTEETMFVRQRQVDLYEFEAILLCIVRVLGHPLLHGETLSQTNKRATK